MCVKYQYFDVFWNRIQAIWYLIVDYVLLITIVNIDKNERFFKYGIKIMNYSICNSDIQPPKLMPKKEVHFFLIWCFVEVCAIFESYIFLLFSYYIVYDTIALYYLKHENLLKSYQFKFVHLDP